MRLLSQRSFGPSAAVVTFAAIGVLGAAGAASAQARVGDLWQLPSAVTPAIDEAAAVRSCESLLSLRPSEESTVREARVVSGKDGAGQWCRVTIEVAIPLARNSISVWLMLPVQNWNGRFLGLGGVGWVPGFPEALDAGAALGFATAITNAGRPYDLSVDPAELSRMIPRNEFLLEAKGKLDWTALQSFAYGGIHEMTVAGKAVTREFYGKDARYAYFSGCSTGGRQGQAEIQRYPEDYDGVLSGAPVVNWAQLAASEFWPVALAREVRDVPQCKLDAVHRAAIAECDIDDGVRDGLISGAGTCLFDPEELVGTRTDCGIIDARDVEVIERIWEGPRRRDGARLWIGIDRAALIHAPESTLAWANPFFEGKPPAARRFSFAAFETLFDQFVARYGAVMGTANSDVGAFAKRGKTIIWHGLADDIIPVANSVQYVDAIRRAVGNRDTDNFLRFYVAPGVGHCRWGEGPQPVAMLESLMEWVEQGRAPGALRSENWDQTGRVTRTRPLCPYPQRPRYRGQGSLDDAANFQCLR